MKTFNKIIAYGLATLLIISTTFHFAIKKAFAVEMEIELGAEWIEDIFFPIFSQGSEWTFSNAGLRLKDAIEEYSISSNISGTGQSIDYTSQYNSAYSIYYGLDFLLDPLDMNDADEFVTAFMATQDQYTKDFTAYSLNQTLTEFQQSELYNVLIDPQTALQKGYNTVKDAWNDCVIKKIEMGGLTVYATFTSTGEWLGSTLENVLFNAESLSLQDVNGLKQTINTQYPQVGSVYRSNSIHTILDNTSQYYPKSYDIQFDFSRKDLFFYADSVVIPNVGAHGSRNLHLVYMSSLGFPTLQSNSVIFGNNQFSSITSVGSIGTSTFTIDNVEFTNITLKFTYDNGRSQGYYLDNALYPYFSDLASIQAYISSNFDSVVIDSTIPPYAVPMVDESSQPYVVPDTRNLATTIDHIYPALDKLKEAIETIPAEVADAISLVDTIPATIAEDIADIIADIIADAISIPEVLEDTSDPDNPTPDPDPDNPLPEYPPELPSWFWPTLFPDIFDFKGLEIFKPIFDIVGTNYSMYSVWSMIPAIIIFVVIIYFIISVL